jgi:putative peptidoglycan lipid II flippase
MVGLVMLAKPLLFTLLQYGAFTAHDVNMASMSLSALALGLPAFALVKVVAPAFYARQDTKTPVRAGIIAMIVSMLLNIVFVGGLLVLWASPGDDANGWWARLSTTPGLHAGLGLASACASYLNLALLWRALRKSNVYVAHAGWWKHWLRLLLACGAMALVLTLLLSLWPDWANTRVATRLYRLAALVLAGAATFSLVMYAMGLRLRDLRGD